MPGSITDQEVSSAAAREQVRLCVWVEMVKASRCRWLAWIRHGPGGVPSGSAQAGAEALRSSWQGTNHS